MTHPAFSAEVIVVVNGKTMIREYREVPLSPRGKVVDATRVTLDILSREVYRDLLACANDCKTSHETDS